MMKILFKLCIAALVIIATSHCFLKAQVMEECLCTADVTQNENQMAVDTCGFEKNAAERFCGGDWQMRDWDDIQADFRAYAKRGWFVNFYVDAIILPAAPHDTVIEVSWEKIDSSFVDLRKLFKHIEEKYGSSVLRKRDPEFSTGELGRSYNMTFEKYVNLMEFFNDSNIGSEEVGFLFNFPEWETGIEENREHQIKYYPNPTSENITISIPQNNSFKTTKLTLRDITGREMFLKEIDALQDSYTFSVQEIPTGVYMLEVRSGNEVFTKQVSVIR